jgi:hypothetical protein
MVSEGSDALDDAYECVDALRHVFVVAIDYEDGNATLSAVEAAGEEADSACEASEDSAISFWDSAEAIGL